MSQVKAIIWERCPAFFREASLVILSSILIGLFGQIAIPLPFTPVPLATQPQLILLLASFLGPRRSVASVLAFLAQGAMGLPVFAGAVGGVAKLIGPTGGYLLGYIAAAWLTGYLINKVKQRTALKTFLAMAVGNAVIFIVGCSYLSLFVGFQSAVLLGVVPFLLGDLLKLIFCSYIFQKVETKL